MAKLRLPQVSRSLLGRNRDRLLNEAAMMGRFLETLMGLRS